MISTILGVGIRISSNSFLNVFQKFLTQNGNKSTVINFYTYLGISFISLFLLTNIHIAFSNELVINFLIMGVLGALGNFFIIKALSIGDLSSLAPINSYKPVVALIIAFLYLGETPSLLAIVGIAFIIVGTYCLYSKKDVINIRAVIYRVLALIFSGSEAVFIKKVLLLTNLPVSFALWAFSGLIFATIFLLLSKHKPQINNVKYQLLLILTVMLMQYSTNFVFSKINVSSALALFQISTILSVFLGINIFKEKGLLRKVTASVIMLVGAVIIILN